MGYLRYWISVFILANCIIPAHADALPEYQLKAAILYNFTTFIEWPEDIGSALNLCVYGEDPFGEYLDALQDKKVSSRLLIVHRVTVIEELNDCHAVFITRSANKVLPEVVGQLHGKPVLTIADMPSAAKRGVILNMIVEQNRISFDANISAAANNGLTVSSKLLRLAKEVIQ